MQKTDTQVAIIGAGPGGTTASIFLSKAGIKHIILDKAVFPRDKVCGDALSGKTVTILKRIDSGLLQQLHDDERYLNCWGVQFIAPNGKKIDVPIREELRNQQRILGFVGKRMDFDNFLFELIDPNFADIKTGCNVNDIIMHPDKVEISYQENGFQKKITCQMVIGAEGDRSIVAKKLAKHKMDPRYYAAGLRAYYKNVSDFHPDKFIELHFINEVLPGYLWIFPLPNNEANVGIGLLSEKIRSKNLRIKDMMLDAINNNPNLKDRFKHAELIDDIQGWGLPLGSVKRNISGNRFLLVGDAASLIDPFTGEGIGNAMVSGEFAAHSAVTAIKEGDYSAAFLKLYDKKVYDRLFTELRLSYRIQRLVNRPWLFNFLANKVTKNKTLQETLSFMFEDINMRAKLKSPNFYFKLLFNL